MLETPEEIATELQRAVQPILEKVGGKLLVGGVLNVLKQDAKGKWERQYRLTIRKVEVSKVAEPAVVKAEAHAHIPQLDPTGTPNPTGDVCMYCGSSRLIRSAACLLCLECGLSNGCS